MNFIIFASSTTVTDVVQGIITGVICLLILGAVFYIIYRKKKENTNLSLNEEINKILNDITDMVVQILTDTIKNIDFGKYESIAEAQAAFLQEVYDKVYTYAFSILEEEFKDQKNLIELAKSILTRERIEEFVNEIFGREEIQSKLITHYNEYIEEKTAEAQKEDEAAEQKGQDYENGTIETDDIPVEDLDPTKLPGVEDPELIPHEEREEEVIDPENDPSVEIVKTETVPIVEDLGNDTDTDEDEKIPSEESVF